jgi:hypothetical protein
MIEASVNPVARNLSILFRVPGENNRPGQDTSVVIPSSPRHQVEARHNHCDAALLLLEAD